MIVVTDIVFSSANTKQVPVFSQEAILLFFKGESALQQSVVNGSLTNVSKLDIDDHLSDISKQYADILDSNECGMLECGNKLVEKLGDTVDYSNTSIFVTSAYQFHENVYHHKQSKKQILQQLISCGSILATLIQSHGMVANMSSTCSSLSSTISISKDVLNNAESSSIIVLSGDNVSTDVMMNHYHQGFFNIGAIKRNDDVNEPFNGTSGLKLGAGCGAMMLSQVEHGRANDVQLVHSQCRNIGKKTLGLVNEFNQAVFRSFMSDCCEKLQVASIPAHSMLYVGHDTGTAVCTEGEFNILHSYFKTDIGLLTLMSCKHLLGHTMGHNQEHYYGIYLMQNYKTIIQSGLSVLYTGDKHPHPSHDTDHLLTLMNSIDYLCVGTFGMSGNVCFTVYRLLR